MLHAARMERRWPGSVWRVTWVSLVALVLIEVLSRWILSIFYDRRFPSELVQVDRYGSSNGLVPSRGGAVWGARFSSDPLGGRTVENACDTCAYWLHLGDSVAEGVGVDDSSTASSRTARATPDLRVINLAHIGHSTCDERNVLSAWIDTCTRVARVTVLYTLNDVYGEASAGDLPDAGRRDGLAGARRWLEAHYATYRALKLFLLQGSDSYYRYDAGYYRADDPHFLQAMACVDSIQALCAANGSDLEVVMLPYRSQVDGNDDPIPQEMVRAHCASAGIPFMDVLPAFRRAGRSAELYLFADEIHLSEQGHAMLARILLEDRP